MSLQFIIGRSGSGKSYQMYREIIDKSIHNDNLKYLIIVPEQFTLQTQKDIVSMHPYGGTMNIDILSFMRLAYRVFDEVGGGDTPVLEDTGKSMVLRKIVAKRKKELKLFNHAIQKQGFIDELKSLISEFYQYSISISMLEHMQAAASNKPLLKDKLHDLIIIYKAFQEYLENKFITAEEILDVLCRVIDKSDLIAGSIICLDGFTGFTPAQYKLLTLLMKKAKKVQITVTIDKKELHIPDQEFQLFHLSKKTISKLTDIARKENITIEPPLFMEDLNGSKVPYRYRNNPALAALESGLFQYPYKPFKEEQDAISIHAARDRSQEVSFVLQEIKYLIREKGYRYRDIAVVTGDIAAYARELGREFDKAGIPCFIDNKREILSNPFVEMIRSVLDIVRNNFDYESVFRYLRCGLSNIKREDVDILENYVIALGIRGYHRWQKEWQKTYKGQKEGELIRLNEIRQAFLEEVNPLYEILKDPTKTVMDYTKALYDFGVRMNVAAKLEAYSLGFNEENLLEDAREYEQIYDIVMDLYEKLVELLGDEVLPLREYIDVLEAGFTEAKVGLIPPGLDQIMVGDIERTRLKDIKALFFVGVNDGIIPKASSKGGILTDMDKDFLNQEIELAPTAKQAAYIDKFYLYLNMSKPQERLYLTFSRQDDDGKAIRPSYLVETLRKLFPALKIQDEEEKKDLNHILGVDGGLNYLIEGMRKYHYEEPDSLWQELFSYYYSKEEYKPVLQNLINAVFYVNQNKGLSKQIAKELYGNYLSGSVTRFEQYAACAFAHFVSYGLELRERQEYRLTMPDIGILFHNAIELFSRKLEESEYNWHTIPDDIREQWCAQCVREAAETYGNAIFGSSSRYKYVVRRVERITRRTLWALSEQIKKGDFEPVGFELYFTGEEKLKSLNFDLSEDEKVALRGRIDRLDIYEDKDKLMVKVIDYKTGATAFDLLSLYYGLQIQLAVYMNAALELLKRENPGKEVIPAGILYYNIDDPFVDKGSQIEDAILKELKLNGIVNSSKEVIEHLDKDFYTEGEGLRPSVKSSVIPVETNKDGYPTKRSSVVGTEKLYALEEYVNSVIYRYGKKIMEGAADIKPYQMGKRRACDFCQYQGICGFDTKVDGFSYQNLAALSNDEVWEKIVNRKDGKKEEKEGGQGDAMDERTTESY